MEDNDYTAEDTAGYSSEDIDIYDQDGRREQNLQDEIDNWEEGFMQGYDESAEDLEYEE